jgi:bacillithiol system protein YtxJ
MDWNTLTTTQDLNQIVDRSHNVPCLIFKHSTRCSISFMAKHRLEEKWDFSATQIEPYYLDLISNRNVSNEIADRFQVYHESPQILLIKNGECVHDASHLDISVEEIKEVLY